MKPISTPLPTPTWRLPGETLKTHYSNHGNPRSMKKCPFSYLPVDRLFRENPATSVQSTNNTKVLPLATSSQLTDLSCKEFQIISSCLQLICICSHDQFTPGEQIPGVPRVLKHHFAGAKSSLHGCSIWRYIPGTWQRTIQFHQP